MRQKAFFIFLALLISISACKSPTSPEPEPTPGQISGTVTNASTGAPIAGASMSTQPATVTVSTDSQGQYTINNVQPKSYTVTASATGYFSASVSTTVTAGKTATANIALEVQADYSGSWSGTTSQGKAISFKIADNTITSISYNFVVESSSGILFLFGSINFTGNTFQISGTIPYTTIQYVIKGTFSSSTTANGTADFTKGTTVVNDTWSATKQ